MYNKRTTLWFLGILTLFVFCVAFVVTRSFLYPVAAAIVLAVVFDRSTCASRNGRKAAKAWRRCCLP